VAQGYGADLALEGQGGALAAWVDSPHPSAHAVAPQFVQVASRPAGGTWGSLTTLSEGQFGAAHAALDARGDALVWWVRGDGEGSVAESAFRPAGGTWQAATDLPAEWGSPGSLSIALDARGDAVAVWEHLAGPNHVVVSAFRPAGRRWETPQDISAPSSGATSPELVMNARGDAIAVWNSGYFTSSALQAAVRTPGKGWGRPRQLWSSNLAPVAPHAALDARGDAVVVWVGVDGLPSGSTVEAATRAAGGAWQKPYPVSARGQIALAPDLAMSARGDAIVVWELEQGRRGVIQAATVQLPPRKPERRRSRSRTRR